MIQLVVRHMDNSVSKYPVLQSWVINSTINCIEIDRDLPRKVIPLGNVKDVTVEEVPVNATREGRNT